MLGRGEVCFLFIFFFPFLFSRALATLPGVGFSAGCCWLVPPWCPSMLQGCSGGGSSETEQKGVYFFSFLLFFPLLLLLFLY